MKLKLSTKDKGNSDNEKKTTNQFLVGFRREGIDSVEKCADGNSTRKGVVSIPNFIDQKLKTKIQLKLL